MSDEKSLEELGGVSWQGNRRDTCYELGVVASQLTDTQAVRAWRHMARSMEKFGDKDVPKFGDLLGAYNAAVIVAKMEKV